MLLLFGIQITGCDFCSSESSLYYLFTCQTGHKSCQNVAQSDLQSWVYLLVLMEGNEYIAK